MYMHNLKNFVTLKKNFLEGGGEGVVDGFTLKTSAVAILFLYTVVG